MKQKQFEEEHAKLWQDIEFLLGTKNADACELPSLYRRLCQSLALAIQRGYSSTLTSHLRKLVSQCHSVLYGTAIERPAVLRNWLLADFPRTVRAEWRLMLVVMLLFWGVSVAIGVLVWLQPDWAYSIMSPQKLAEFSRMYQPSQAHIGRGGDDGDFQMFGLYIWNNVSIGFRTFASGLFGGIPSLVSLLFNAVQLGVVAAWLSRDPGTASTFWPFVVTHSSFELTGLLLSAMCGMRLGLSLLAPGRMTRRHSLMITSRKIFPVVVGAAILTFVAAFFEAFWSASTTIPASVKYTVAAICWSAVFSYFALVGRGKT